MSDTADTRLPNSDMFWYPPLAKADTYMDTKADTISGPITVQQGSRSANGFARWLPEAKWLSM
jgi:hypothetical protein